MKKKVKNLLRPVNSLPTPAKLKERQVPLIKQILYGCLTKDKNPLRDSDQYAWYDDILNSFFEKTDAGSEYDLQDGLCLGMLVSVQSRSLEVYRFNNNY